MNRIASKLANSVRQARENQNEHEAEQQEVTAVRGQPAEESAIGSPGNEPAAEKTVGKNTPTTKAAIRKALAAGEGPALPPILSDRVWPD